MELTADIKTRFSSGGFDVDVALRIEGEAPIVVLFGPSGAGKTTVLRCIAGLEPSSGRVAFNGQLWSGIPPQRRSIGCVFQDYALFPHLDVRENIAYGLRGLPVAVQADRVKAMASTLQIQELLSRRPAQLSGGEQQRVALARALVRQPALLLLDEPFSALDSGTREVVRTETARLLRSLHIPTIIVTHDWVDALALGDHMVVMSQGRVLQTGSPQEVLTRPQHSEVASVVGVETVVAGRLKSRRAGIVLLEVGSTELSAAEVEGEAFHVCIRGEDVTLEEGRAERSSARNHLKGTVREVTPAGILVRVVVDVGFRLVALVTRQAAEDLALAVGAEVYAVFKASAVHLIPR